jgi:branched-chain amino acid transport system substrate-binding protein
VIPTSRRLLPVLVLVVALVAAACGSSLTDEEVLSANGVSAETSDAVIDGGTEPGSGTTVVPGDPGSPSVSAPLPGATPQGGPTDATPVDEVGTPGETGPIIIGSVGNYSGPAGAAQSGLPRAVQVWAADINAKGGLFGREVRVIVQDDGGDPARYAAAVQDLVENRKVIAFVGQGAGLSAQGGVRYLAEKRIPVIGTECAAPEWWLPSPNNFPQCADAPYQSYSFINGGVKLTGERAFGFVYCGEASSCTVNAPYYQDSTPAGAQTVYGKQISIAQIDFTANCQEAQRTGVKVMAILAEPGTIGRFVRSCDRQGFKPQYLGVSISVTGTTNRLPGLERMALGLPTFPFAGASSPAIDEFTAAMDKYATSEPGPSESQGWAAAKLFQLAATRAAAARGSLSPETLIAAMRTVKGETLGGLTVALDFTSETPNNQRCAFMMQGDGKGGWSAPFGAAPHCVPGI